MQNHYNLIYREEEREMIPLCRDLGVALIPWSPLARGFLAGNRTPDDIIGRPHAAGQGRRVCPQALLSGRRLRCGEPPQRACLATRRKQCRDWPTPGCCISRDWQRPSSVPARSLILRRRWRPPKSSSAQKRFSASVHPTSRMQCWGILDPNVGVLVNPQNQGLWYPPC